MVEGADGALGDDLPGSAEDPAQCRTGVLEDDLERQILEKQGGIGRRVDGSRGAMAPRGRHYAHDHTRRGRSNVSGDVDRCCPDIPGER